VSQVNPVKYKGLVSGLRTIVAEEGVAGTWKGFGPTLIGYSFQGAFKYGLYEVFKDYYMNLAGEEASAKYKGAIWLAGSASAEVFCHMRWLGNSQERVQTMVDVHDLWTRRARVFCHRNIRHFHFLFHPS